MSVALHRSQYLLGATKWAPLRGDPSTAGFAGVSEETGSVFAIDPVANTLLREPFEEASAVAAGSDGVLWVVTRDGWLASYTAAGLVLQDSANIEADGEAVAATDGNVVYCSRSGGRITRVDSYAPSYDTYLPSPILGLLVGDECIYALLANADLLTLVDDTVRRLFRVESTLNLPAVYGLRDMGASLDSLFFVGTDRLGAGSVVTVGIADPLAPTLESVDRVQSPFIVLTTDGVSRVGTVLPQTPYTMPEVPWQGRTDCIRTIQEI